MAGDVIVRQSNSGEWSSITGIPGDGADRAVCIEAAGSASQLVDRPVLCISVLDSDVLIAALALPGGKTAVVEMHVGLPNAPPTYAWASVLAPGVTLADLAQGWARAAVFAEEWLAQMETSIGCEAGLILNDEGLGTHVGSSARQFRPAAPVSLGHPGGDHQIRAFRATLATVTVVAHSTGGPGEGIRATLWGPAVDSALVRPVRADLVIGPPGRGPTAATTTDFDVANNAAFAIWPDVVVPQGFPDQEAAFGAGPVDAGIDRWMSSRIQCQATLVCQTPGQDDLYVALVPLAAPDSGALWPVDIVVS